MAVLLYGDRKQNKNELLAVGIGILIENRRRF